MLFSHKFLAEKSDVIKNDYFLNIPKQYPLGAAFANQYLTKSEYLVLYYLIHGLTTKEIAHTLKRSPKTIESHIMRIKLKLQCTNKTQIILKTLKMGIQKL